MLPILQKAQYLSLRADSAQLEVDGVDRQKIPVGVRGVAIFKVGDDDQSITNAATRFLDDQPGQNGQMHNLVKEVFHGHLRSIIGSMTVEEIVTERQKLATEVLDGSKQEMANLGLTVDSLQIQSIDDMGAGYIAAMAAPNNAAIQRQAKIAQAEADQASAEAQQASARKQAEFARQTAVVQAQYKAEIDKAQAEASQSGPLAQAEAQRAVISAPERRCAEPCAGSQPSSSRMLRVARTAAIASASSARSGVA